jgi:uroporphyrinogen decarboxylase
MGYDYMRIAGGGNVTISWPSKHLATEDTADLSKGQRSWVDEGTGMITNWDEFEQYPWPDPAAFDYTPYECAARNLPDGMQLMVCPSNGVFETVAESLLGFDGLSYMLVDDPELVAACFKRAGEIIGAFYETIVTMDNIGGFFQGDDMGFKTGTFLSPDHMCQYVLPWHKKYAEIAHAHDKLYWLHACGNLERIMDDIIDDVKVDAYHSFQDVIMPVADYLDKYRGRVAALGGVDVDSLGRLDEQDLREYVRAILDRCMPGRYALGSGNSVANYIPPENYIAMLEEGRRYVL